MTPSHMSPALPGLQLAWDATSLKALMFCPRYYQLTQLEGWRGNSVDLEFGGYAASGFETFRKTRALGATRNEAALAAIKRVMLDTWDPEKDEPWGGAWVEQWRCTGTEPYKNRNGNRAKCPWSHKGQWHPLPEPGTCGECGSPTETKRMWLKGHRAKDRFNLVRAVAWWAFDQPERYEDGPRVLMMPDGTPAVELSFVLPLPWKAGTEETFLIAGHLDSVLTTGHETFVSDNKTTTRYLGKEYFSQFSPDAQVDTYDLVGSILFPDENMIGVQIDATQVLADSVRHSPQTIHRTEEQREEFFKELEWWLKQAERYAREGYWPMNRASCWSCKLRSVCGRTPGSRERLLEASFERRHWNPLEER